MIDIITRINKIKPESGDTVVLTCQSRITRDGYERLVKQLRKSFTDPTIKFMILEDGADIEVKK